MKVKVEKCKKITLLKKIYIVVDIKNKIIKRTIKARILKIYFKEFKNKMLSLRN